MDAHRCPLSPYLPRRVAHARARIEAISSADFAAGCLRGARPGSQTPQSRPSQGVWLQVQCQTGRTGHTLIPRTFPALRRVSRLSLDQPCTGSDRLRRVSVMLAKVDKLGRLVARDFQETAEHIHAAKLANVRPCGNNVVVSGFTVRDNQVPVLRLHRRCTGGDRLDWDQVAITLRDRAAGRTSR